MQQEDDLRGLAKIMEFMRAVSIILVVMNVYWYCYAAIDGWHLTMGIVDKILMNFDRTAGLFHSILTPSYLPYCCWHSHALAPKESKKTR